jgi:hypothetical protein
MVRWYYGCFRNVFIIYCKYGVEWVVGCFIANETTTGSVKKGHHF